MKSTSHTLLILGQLFLSRFAVSRQSSSCQDVSFENPFIGDPEITEISVDRVRIHWEDAISKPSCVDNLSLRYWQVGKYFSGQIKRTSNLGPNALSVEVTVPPKVEHRFQVEAKRGSHTLRSSKIQFATSSADTVAKYHKTSIVFTVLAFFLVTV